MSDQEKRIQEIIDDLKRENLEYDEKEAYQKEFKRNAIIIAALESLQRERQEPEPLKDDNGCEYHCDNVDDSPWECSKCGAAWSLESGNPFENGMKFCSECGRPIRSVRWNGWYYNSEDDFGDREIVVTREEYDAATDPKGEATT